MTLKEELQKLSTEENWINAKYEEIKNEMYKEAKQMKNFHIVRTNFLSSQELNLLPKVLEKFALDGIKIEQGVKATYLKGFIEQDYILSWAE